MTIKNKSVLPKTLATQTSLFFVAMAVSQEAVAASCNPGRFDPGNDTCTPAQPGHFVSGFNATEQEKAPVGFFVANEEATAPTPAPPGSFVPITGQSQATQARVGFYVPTSGASAETAVSGGFYTVTQGADSQMPAGGLAAPLTAALQSSALFGSMAADLLNDSSTYPIKIATAYQHNSVNQEGFASGRLNSDIGAIILQASILHEKTSDSGVQIAYGHHRIKNSNQTNDDGNSFEIGAFKSGNIFNAGRYKAFLVYGQTRYDNQRNVTIDAAGTNQERLTTNGNIAWFGARSEIAHPILPRIDFIGQLGLLNYSLDSISENGTATLNGSATASIAGLSAKSSNFLSAPFMTGLSYDIAPKAGKNKVSPFTFEFGIIGNLNSEKKIRLTSTNSGFAFDLPVTQSSLIAGLVALKLNEFEIARGFKISGITKAAFGEDVTSLSAGINITKSF